MNFWSRFLRLLLGEPHEGDFNENDKGVPNCHYCGCHPDDCECICARCKKRLKYCKCTRPKPPGQPWFEDEEEKKVA